jgi:hypothetical protein
VLQTDGDMEKAWKWWLLPWYDKSQKQWDASTITFISGIAIIMSYKLTPLTAPHTNMAILMRKLTLTHFIRNTHSMTMQNKVWRTVSIHLIQHTRPVQKVFDFYFFSEKPVSAGWHIWSQWWGGPSCAYWFVAASPGASFSRRQLVCEVL